MKWKLLPSRRAGVDETTWSQAIGYCRYAQALDAPDRQRLRRLVEQFLRAKSFDGAGGFAPTPHVCAVVAVKACAPILNLGIDYYAGWSDIVVYPADFRVRDEYVDYAGVVHRESRDLCGQSLSQGPMVLSWDAIAQERQAAARDVVIHECAHKLDILNGAANGFPPLHAHMSAKRWSRIFQDAYRRFADAVETGDETDLDPYAATDPAEFFAVMSEAFFTGPALVYRDFRPAYAELVEFYRQDPLALARSQK